MTESSQDAEREMIESYRAAVEDLGRLPTRGEMTDRTDHTLQDLAAVISDGDPWPQPAKDICERLDLEYYNAESVERAHYLLSIIGSELALPSPVVDRARDLVVMFAREGMPGTRVPEVAGSAAMLACHERDVARPKGAVERAVETAVERETADEDRPVETPEYEVSNLSRHKLRLMQETGVQALQPGPEAYARYIAGEINEPRVVDPGRLPAEETVPGPVIEKTDAVLSEYCEGIPNPVTAGASALYAVIDASGLSINQDSVAVPAHVTPVSVRNRYAEIKEAIAGDVDDEAVVKRRVRAEAGVSPTDLIPTDLLPAPAAERAADVAAAADPECEQYGAAFVAGAATYAVAQANDLPVSRQDVDDAVNPSWSIDASYERFSHDYDGSLSVSLDGTDVS